MREITRFRQCYASYLKRASTLWTRKVHCPWELFQRLCHTPSYTSVLLPHVGWYNQDR